MKKTILKKALCVVLAVMLILPASGFSMLETELMNNKPHVYTILPGSEEWKNLTPKERYTSCYVSENEASNMTTAALVETVLNYPYLINVYAFDTITKGIKSVSSYFPALPELLSRTDILQELDIYLNNQGALYNDEGVINLKIYDANMLKTYLQNLSVANNVYLPYYVTKSVKTPNNSTVQVIEGLTWDDHEFLNGIYVNYSIAEAQSEAFLKTFPTAEIVGEPSPLYNCHSYAWYSTTFTSNNYWMDNPSPYMTDGSYEASSEKVGNRVIYKNLTNGEIIHSAIVTSSSTVRSKWGLLALFKHDPFDCPYTNHYDTSLGSVAISYWERAN